MIQIILIEFFLLEFKVIYIAARQVNLQEKVVSLKLKYKMFINSILQYKDIHFIKYHLENYTIVTDNTYKCYKFWFVQEIINIAIINMILIRMQYT